MSESTDSLEAAPRVQSVDRAMRILFAVAQSKDGLKAADVVAATGLPRQACYHILHTLVTSGALTRSGSGRYVLGLRIASLVEGFGRHLAPPEYLAPIIRRLAEETGETVYASGWWSGEIVTLVTARGTNSVQAMELARGTYSDAHARASGKLLLAYSDAPARADYLAHHKLGRRTKATITTLAALKKDFEQIRARGYATDMEEFSAGLCCLAVGLGGDSPRYAVTVAAPSERFRQKFDSYLAAMRRVALEHS
ncbi:MAG TPA: IclR family transcriptional regulator [Reyranella sp.]|nr:IclR family transcriptional regulator [Reyranella sp.]